MIAIKKIAAFLALGGAFVLMECDLLRRQSEQDQVHKSERHRLKKKRVKRAKLPDAPPVISSSEEVSTSKDEEQSVPAPNSSEATPEPQVPEEQNPPPSSPVPMPPAEKPAENEQ